VWAMRHTGMDQTSFSRRTFSYKHYQFSGKWELRDQGTIEAGAAVRELFLVFPGDLIEFRLTEPDPCAKIEIKGLGYIVKGTSAEIQRWFACHAYMEKLEAHDRRRLESGNREATAPESCPIPCPPPQAWGRGILSPLSIIGQAVWGGAARVYGGPSQ
jgi:hypothetical protein